MNLGIHYAECTYAAAIGIKTDLCRDDILSGILYSSGEFSISVMSSLVHIMLTFASQDLSGVTLLYCLNPIVLLADPAPPIHLVLQIVILVTFLSVDAQWILVSCLCLILLISESTIFLCLVPFALRLIVTDLNIPPVKAAKSPSFSAISTTFVIAIIRWLLQIALGQQQYLNHGSRVMPLLTVARGDGYSILDSDMLIRNTSGQPTIGIWWYLHTEAFSMFSVYFKFLVSSQPFVFVMPLYIRIAKKRPQHAMTIMLAVIYFFRVDTTVCDIFFLIALTLARHPKTVTNMRHINLILLGIATPCVLSGAMKSLWLRTGTGNANFMFFQGLVLWLFFALVVIEFTSATVLEVDNEREEEEKNNSSSSSS